MPGVTRSRSDAIQTSAARIVKNAGGVEYLDSLSIPAGKAILIGLYKQLQDEESVAYDTARSHIARACRRARGQTIAPDGWGGRRTAE